MHCHSLSYRIKKVDYFTCSPYLHRNCTLGEIPGYPGCFGNGFNSQDNGIPESCEIMTVIYLWNFHGYLNLSRECSPLIILENLVYYVFFSFIQSVYTARIDFECLPLPSLMYQRVYWYSQEDKSGKRASLSKSLLIELRHPRKCKKPKIVLLMPWKTNKKFVIFRSCFINFWKLKVMLPHL